MDMTGRLKRKCQHSFSLPVLRGLSWANEMCLPSPHASPVRPWVAQPGGQAASQAPRQPFTQAPRHSGTQAPRRQGA